MGLPIRGIVPEGDKVMRLHAQTAAIENGFVHLPEQASWLPDYLLEMTSFPKGKYADEVDSTSQALHWIETRQYREGHGDLRRHERALRKAARTRIWGSEGRHASIPRVIAAYWLTLTRRRP